LTQPLEVCETALKTALSLGSSEAEAAVLGGTAVRVDMERGQVRTSSRFTDVGLSVRAVLQGRIGFAYSNRLTLQQAAQVAKAAAKAAQASVRDEKWSSLPHPGTIPSVEGTFDPAITRVTAEEMVELVTAMADSAAQFDRRVLPAFGEVSAATHRLVIVNSCGVEAEDAGTVFALSLGAMARSGSRVSPLCSEVELSRRFEPNPDRVGLEAARLAVSSLNAGPTEPGSFPVLFDRRAIQALLGFTVVSSLRGDMVHRGRSVYAGRLGEVVASKHLTLSDDGTLAGGLLSGRVDMEGVPRRRTSLIVRGELKGFLYDNYWARIEGRESTGNAARGGGPLRSPAYATLPRIEPTNMVIEVGDLSEEELIEEVKNGYYVREVQGAHQSNPESGEFSVAAVPAFRIIDGEVRHSVPGAMVVGNAYDLVRRIRAFGKESRQVGFLVAPKVVFDGVRVVAA
jgi:PmbA protein